MKPINSSDETHDRESLPLVVAVGSQSNARDEATSMCVIKCIETSVVGSRSDASDAFSAI